MYVVRDKMPHYTTLYFLLPKAIFAGITRSTDRISDVTYKRVILVKAVFVMNVFFRTSVYNRTSQ